MPVHNLHLVCGALCWTPVERGHVAGINGQWFRDQKMRRFFLSDADLDQRMQMLTRRASRIR